MARRFSRAAACAPALLLSAGAFLPAPAAAQQAELGAEACAAVERAVRAIGEAERFHSKLVARTPGRRRPAEEEQFVIGDVVYASSPASGRWVKLQMRPSDRASLSSSVTAYPPLDCRDEGAADLGGVPTRVYAYRQDMPGRDGAANPAHGRLWVAASDGRPRRYEGQHGEVRVVLTLDYDAVEPPFGKR